MIKSIYIVGGIQTTQTKHTKEHPVKQLKDMSTSEIMRALAEHLKTRIEEYLAKRERFDDELAHDLDDLSVTYGPELVRKMFERRGIVIPKRQFQKSKTKARGTKSNGDQTAPSSGTSASVKNGIGISALTPMVAEAVQQFRGKRFVRGDVEKILSAKGAEFDPSHVSFILRRMEELETVDKQKSDVGGPPLNVYQFKAKSGAKS